MATNKRSNGPQIALVAFGLVVLVLAIIFLMPHTLAGPAASTFAAVDLIVLYALLACPLLLGSNIANLTSGRIVSLGIYWKAFSAYALLTVVLSLMAIFLPFPPLRFFIIAQLLGIFGLAAAVYAGNATEQHIEQVGANQAAQQDAIGLIRDAAAQLSIRASHLDAMQSPAHAQLVKSCNRIADDVRYLTPVRNPQAIALERQIESGIRELVSHLGSTDLGDSAARAACEIAQDTLLLIDQRKAMRN